MTKIYKLLNKKYPQNYVLRNPFLGTLLVMVFIFVFMVIYKPLKGPVPHLYPYAVTMAVYCLGPSMVGYGLIKLLKRVNYFSEWKWTFIKELIAIGIILTGNSVVVYFLGFVMEFPSDRWNLATFGDSCKNVFLIEIIPWSFLVLSNYRHLLVMETEQAFESDKAPASKAAELIQISSKLKKEELGFYPEQFIYAESDGNYVVFYLNHENHIRKEVIRNSISEIERQLSKIPFIIRTHRAFIVNVKKVSSKKGSTLGYRLKFSDIDSEIPVSRQNIRNFDQLLKEYRITIHNKILPPVTIPGSIS